RGGGDVVIAGEVATLHPRAVVDREELGRARIAAQPDQPRAGIQRVGDDLGEDRLFQRAGICVAQVFEQMMEVDSSLAHSVAPTGQGSGVNAHSAPVAPLGICDRRGGGVRAESAGVYFMANLDFTWRVDIPGRRCLPWPWPRSHRMRQ